MDDGTRELQWIHKDDPILRGLKETKEKVEISPDILRRLSYKTHTKSLEGIHVVCKYCALCCRRGTHRFLVGGIKKVARAGDERL
jgi:hypothetical protein